MKVNKKLVGTLILVLILMVIVYYITKSEIVTSIPFISWLAGLFNGADEKEEEVKKAEEKIKEEQEKIEKYEERIKEIQEEYNNGKLTNDLEELKQLGNDLLGD
jgi:cell shape-determining protein MreC